MGDEVVIVEYDAAWPAEFERLRNRAQQALGEVAVGIEHVGSTAVPGLPAKDLVDMVAIIESDDHLPAAIARLEAIGYRARGNLGVEGREVFLWPEGEKRHHLYVSPTTSAELQAQLAFRDLLRTDSALAQSTSPEARARAPASWRPRRVHGRQDRVHRSGAHDGLTRRG